MRPCCNRRSCNRPVDLMLPADWTPPADSVDAEASARDQTLQTHGRRASRNNPTAVRADSSIVSILTYEPAGASRAWLDFPQKESAGGAPLIKPNQPVPRPAGGVRKHAQNTSRSRQDSAAQPRPARPAKSVHQITVTRSSVSLITRPSGSRKLLYCPTVVTMMPRRRSSPSTES